MNELNPNPTLQPDAAADSINADPLRGDFKQLKKLYHRSCNLNAIAVLMGFALAIMIAGQLATDDQYEPSIQAIWIGFTVLYVATVIGLYRRTSWGRILSIIVCTLILINVPFGTIIGAFGLFALFGSPELFGANRVTHRALKAEFKLQKANLKHQRSQKI